MQKFKGQNINIRRWCHIVGRHLIVHQQENCVKPTPSAFSIEKQTKINRRINYLILIVFFSCWFFSWSLTGIQIATPKKRRRVHGTQLLFPRWVSINSRARPLDDSSCDRKRFLPDFIHWTASSAFTHLGSRSNTWDTWGVYVK